MIFERLADIILRRSKLIIAVWIVILVCSIPFAIKADSVLNYGTDSMAGPNAESIEGAEVIAEYFDADESGAESMFLLVVEFNDAKEHTDADDLGAFLNSAKDKFVDPDGNVKISTISGYGTFTNANDPNNGVIIYAIAYKDTFTTGFVSEDTNNLRGFISGVVKDNNLSNLTTYVTGTPAINYDTQKEASKDLSRIDPFTILLILILVGLFFKSFVTSAMPPMTIGAAFGVAMMALFFIGSILNVFYITEMFLLVSMMGAGCDYCIFILARYREERMSGKEHKAAVREAIMWAGESISTSGLAVIIGFGAMSICSFSMISTMGIMLAVGVLIALMAALTLITSILALAGDKLFWPSRPDKFKDGGEAVRGWYGKVSRFGRSYFIKSAKFSIKYAKPILVVAVLFTVPMAYITFTSPSSYDMVGGMSAGEAADGLKEVEKYSNGGMMAPSYIVLELNNPLATIETFDVPVAEGDTVKMGIVNWSNPSELTKLEEFRQSLSSDDNVGDAWGIFVWVQLAEAAAVKNPRPPTMSDHDYALLIYSKVLEDLPIPVAEGISGVIPLVVNYVESQKGQPVTYNDTTVGAVMDYLVDYVGVTSIGGTGTKDASGNDLITVSYVKFTVVTKEESMSDRSMKTIGFLDSKMSDFAKNSGIVTKSWLTGSAAIMFEISEQVNSEFDKVEILAILLIFILLFFVMKSYITPLRSILTILMSVAWTIAITHLLFSELLGFGVLWIIPIILLVICLGLGMDYDILLTTRIKENVRHKGMSNDEAITAAVTHSGSVITICGLIMGGAFGTLMLSGTVMLQEFGFALCFAIIVDALLVRTYIVPAAMHLLGDWNWKGPKFLQKAK